MKPTSAAGKNLEIEARLTRNRRTWSYSPLGKAIVAHARLQETAQGWEPREAVPTVVKRNGLIQDASMACAPAKACSQSDRRPYLHGRINGGYQGNDPFAATDNHLVKHSHQIEYVNGMAHRQRASE